MPTNILDHEKVEARKRAREHRKTAHEALAATANVAMLQHFLAYWGDDIPTKVAGYLPISSEIDPKPVLDHFQGKGATIALPAVIAEAAPLVFRVYTESDALITEKFSSQAPPASAPECIPDLVLVPMLAFNGKGYRLGYGGGFYDRTMAKYQNISAHTRFIGLAYDAQRDDAIPIGEHDLALEAIVSECGVVRP